MSFQSSLALSSTSFKSQSYHVIIDGKANPKNLPKVQGSTIQTLQTVGWNLMLREMVHMLTYRPPRDLLTWGCFAMVVIVNCFFIAFEVQELFTTSVLKSELPEI